MTSGSTSPVSCGEVRLSLALTGAAGSTAGPAGSRARGQERGGDCRGFLGKVEREKGPTIPLRGPASPAGSRDASEGTGSQAGPA